MAAVVALLVVAAVATPTWGVDHSPSGPAPPGPAPSMEPADGRRGARAFRIPAPYRPLVHMRPEADQGPEGPPQGADRRRGDTAQLLATACRQGEHCDTTPQRTQELIEKFLKELAASTRDRSSAEAAAGVRDRDRDRDNKIDPGGRPRPSTEEPTNRLASLYLDNEEAADKSSSSSSESSGSGEAVAGSGEHGWSLLEAKSHRHPYDDRDGWVTLEAVPWAAAKVSKWRPNPGPSRRPPWVTLHHTGYGDEQGSTLHDRWERPAEPPAWHRPPSDFPTAAKPGHPYDYLPHHHADIVTDDRPLHRPPWAPPAGSAEVGGGGGGSIYGRPPPHHSPGRPSYTFPAEPLGLDTLHHHHQQQQHHHHPTSYPGEADGEWVLLSSTKGYSLPPHRRLHQRAVSFSARPLTARRAVRLTVLPAQNGTTNTSTSHGGLLEVHSSFNSVDQDVHDRDRDHQHHHHHDHQNGVVPAQDVPVFAGSPTRPTPATVPVSLGVGSATNFTTQLGGRPLQQQFVRLVPGRKGSTPNPGRALLAAVGAGVLPATVAMLVPLALGRRRRRSTSVGDYPNEDRLLLPETTAMSIKGQNASFRRVKRLHQKRL